MKKYMTRQENMVLNIAHRGARSLAPENTIASARKGFESGADLWETDISVTKDGELILFHDATLIRTTDARKRFPDRSPWHYHDFTLEEIRTLDAGSFFGENDPFGQIKAGNVPRADLEAFRDEKIPTLLEGLAFTRDAGWRINLEIKRLPEIFRSFPVVERILATVKKAGLEPEQVVISSFEHAYLHEVKKYAPEIAVQALLGEQDNMPLNWGNYEFSVYNVLHTQINSEKIRDLARRNIAVNLFTVNDPADMEHFIAAGAAGIITDFPQKLIKFL